MIRRILTVVGIGVLLVVTLASPASAAIGFRYGANTGAVASRNQVAALDKECDSRTVYLDYYVSTIGGLVRYTLYDSNGCNNSGATRNHYPQTVTRARLCETGSGCTAWQYT